MALNDVPKSNQSLGQTVNQINQNFGTVNTQFSVNHVDFSIPGNSNAGKHKKIDFPVQSAAPTPTGTDITVYSKTPTGGVDHVTLPFAQLFWDRTGVPNTNRRIPFTAGSLTASSSNQGWSFLPSGWLIKWGITQLTTTGNITINFEVDATIPVFDHVFTAQVTPFCTTANLNPWNVYLVGVDATSITVGQTASPPGNRSCHFLVIGVAQ